MGRLSLWICAGGGLGFLPKMPGTFGTLWGVLIFFFSDSWSWGFWLGFTLVFIFLSVLLTHFAESFLGSHDHSSIVIDEVAGYLVTVLGFSFSWTTAVLGFVLFRIFDILKPPPVRQIDRGLGGAWGVVLDDVAAGIYAHLTLWGLLFILEKSGIS